jgi:hypothetical protein
MAANIGGGRIVHSCDVCGGVDDHPRHIIAGTNPNEFPAPAGAMVRQVMAATADLPEPETDRILGELTDASTHYRHYDCCRDGGICPNGLCAHLTGGAESKRGAALLRHLTDKPADVASLGDDSIVKAEAR